MDVALVNTNRISPPIAPIGLEYIGETLRDNGFNVDILDLCWAEDAPQVIADFFKGSHYGLCGVTLRNTDDCSYASSHSFMPFFYETVQQICRCTDAMLVLGGAGYSVFPEKILLGSEADAGVWGEGEFPFLKLAQAVKKGDCFDRVPGLVWKDGEEIRRNSSAEYPLENLPVFKWDMLDIPRYFREGGQIGFETKRGCNAGCVYCADPVSKGNTVRLRPPDHVASELTNLLDLGIDCFHTCDSEFNIPESHALDVCRSLIESGLGSKITWYAYCAPFPFSSELASLMAEAGCRGINFGADSCDPEILKALKRGYISDHISQAVRFCRENGMAVMLDLLFGSQGETRESIKTTIDFVRSCAPDSAGIAAGLRLYPGTPLSLSAGEGGIKEGLSGGDGLDTPIYYIEPSLGERMFDIIDEEVGGDPLFLFMNPRDPESNYNYNGNAVLSSAIAGGKKGAFWDILRRLRDES